MSRLNYDDDHEIKIKLNLNKCLFLSNDRSHKVLPESIIWVKRKSADWKFAKRIETLSALI